MNRPNSARPGRPAVPAAWLAAACGALLAGCGGDDGGGNGWCAAGPVVLRVEAPAIWLPGTEVAVEGSGFDPTCGEVRLVLRGTFEGRSVRAEALPSVESPARVAWSVGTELWSGFGGDQGEFTGEVGVAVVPRGGTTRQALLPFAFSLRPSLVPALSAVSPVDVTLNAPVLVTGDGFLGPGEGTTWAVLDGLLRPDAGGGDRTVSEVRLATTWVEPGERGRAEFPFAPTVGGIAPGEFTGTVRLENLHASETVTSAPPLPATFRLGRTLVTSTRPARPSLGARLLFQGAGFIGGGPDELLTLRLDGTLTPHLGTPDPVDGLEIVPRFLSGGEVEYVLVPVVRAGELVAEDFGLAWGRFSGTVRPILRRGGERVEGVESPLELPIGPTRQIVHVAFLPGFSDALRRFGLRAVELDVRDAILDKFRRVYDGFGVEARTEAPPDYYPGGYAVLEIGGPDPNGRGLFGYDNTPGKDVGNLRLHDRLGGSNADVQEDGYPGYGGVFVESFLCWSRHPPADVACPDGIGEADFDRVFDPVRNREVVAGEFPAGTDAARTAAIREAIRVLGNIVGDTVAHEFGHSLGLAHPYGGPDLVHHEPPEDGCLMDSGANRPFAERAELPGTIPGTFCGDERTYLDSILPLE